LLKVLKHFLSGSDKISITPSRDGGKRESTGGKRRENYYEAGLQRLQKRAD
jgi:hypothetical protein